MMTHTSCCGLYLTQFCTILTIITIVSNLHCTETLNLFRPIPWSLAQRDILISQFPMFNTNWTHDQNVKISNLRKRLHERKRRSLSTVKREQQFTCSKIPSKGKSTFLWQISTQPYSYLFGTLHVAYTHVWPRIALSVKRKFAQADAVYFELDLTDPNTLSELGDCQLLPANETLRTILPEQLVTRLNQYMHSFRLWINQWIEPSRRTYATYVYETITKDWQRKRPIWLLLLLNSLTRGEISDRGVPVLDLYLAQQAQRLGKHRGAVEQVDDQCNPLNRISNEQVSFALDLTLKNLESANQFSTVESIPIADKGDIPSYPISYTHPHMVSPDRYNFQPLILTNSTDKTDHSFRTRNQTFPNGLQHHHHHQQQQRNHVKHQPQPQQQTGWILSPVQHLIEQYNCGDLSATLANTRIPQMASLTGSGKTTSTSNKNTMPIQPTDNQTQFVNNTNGLVYLSLDENQFDRNQTKLLIDLELYLNEELIVKRNRRMSEQIIEKLKLAEAQHQSAFFALGAAHFLGHGDTIIDHLRRAGYVITPVPYDIDSEQDKLQNNHHLMIQSHTDKEDISEKPLRMDQIVQNSKVRSIRGRKMQQSSDIDVPKFRPKYVNFDNLWIKIEDFKPSTFFNRRQQPDRRQDSELIKRRESSESKKDWPDGSSARNTQYSKTINLQASSLLSGIVSLLVFCWRFM